MLTIRPTQLETLKREADTRFAESLFAYLKEIYPDFLAERGEEGMRALVRGGIARARGDHGIDAHADQGKFVELQILLGDDFDRDPDLPWVSDRLHNTGLSPSDRMAILWVEAERFLDSDDDDDDDDNDRDAGGEGSP